MDSNADVRWTSGAGSPARPRGEPGARETFATGGVRRGDDHALRLSIRVTPERVRVEVGGRAPLVAPGTLLHARDAPSLGGFGLRIVERMADARGTTGAGHTAIWFELART
jgi:hypothetical protein